MMRVWISLPAFLALCLLVPLSSADAETYTWADEQSIVHFTDDPGLVPKVYRNKLRKLDDDVSSQPESAAEAVGKEGDNIPAADAGTVVQESYGGKSYDQWAKEFADREAAMTTVRRRIDENADLLQAGPGRPVQERLLAERETLLAQFKELKAEYLQQVEIARKAGLQINIEQ